MAIKHLISTFAVGVTLACGTTAASAQLLTFCVDDKAYGGAAGGNQVACVGAGAQSAQAGFTADLLQGSYVEKLQVTAPGMFQATILFDINNYSYQGTAIQTALGSFPALTYDLYAVVNATGTFAGTAFTVNSSTLNVFVDPGDDTSLGFAQISDLPGLAFTGGAGDTLLGSSNLLLSGGGNLGPSGGTDGFAVTYGQFGLTPSGQSFFIAPRPFYLIVYSDGDITDPSFTGTPGTIFQFQGEASANFLRVPEPTSLALVGLALLGLGATRRRKT